MFTLILMLTLLCAGVTPALAQPSWTFQEDDQPDPSGPGRLNPLSLTSGNQLLAIGRSLSWRLSADRSQRQALTCPDGTDGFTRTTTDVRQGFLARGWNDTTDTVGTDAGQFADGVIRNVGVFLAADGTCHIYRFPGSVNTELNGINTLGDQVGYAQMPTPANLRNRRGFLKKADGTILSFNGLGADSALFPEGINQHGDVIGYAYTQISADNFYVYTAFVCEWEQCLPLKDPNGRNLWITGVGDNRYAVAVTSNSERALGGQSWLIHLPSKTFWAIQGRTIPGHTLVTLTARGINALGWLVGRYTLRDDNCIETPATTCTTLHAFLATPTGPLPLPTPATPRKTRLQHLREWLRSARQELRDWHDLHTDADDTRWQPVLLDGKVVWKRGEEVMSD